MKLFICEKKEQTEQDSCLSSVKTGRYINSHYCLKPLLCYIILVSKEEKAIGEKDKFFYPWFHLKLNNKICIY